MLKIKEIEEKLKDLNEDARNWASMTPGGYGHIVVNCEGHIYMDEHNEGDIYDYNYARAYPILAPATLEQVLKGLDHWGIKYE